MVPAPRIDYDGRRLVDAHGTHDPVRIVLHDTESHDARGIRDLAGIATYWNGVSWGPGAHVGVDGEGFSARYVDDRQIAYHVANRNTGSLGIEIIGFARWAPSLWLLRPKQLDEVAQWLAHLSTLHGIPLTRSTERGVSTHNEQSKRYGGTHWDPGRFPVDLVIARARALVAESRKPRQKAKTYTEPPFYLWLRWDLGEGEFKGDPHNLRRRPSVERGVPVRIPDAWWTRREKFLESRKAAAEHDLATV